MLLLVQGYIYFGGIAGLFSAGGMGLWHGVEYYEEEKLKTEPWKASWNEVTSKSLTPHSSVTTFSFT